jgi:cytochrome P450
MLDAVVHETLRLHPSVVETTRQVAYSLLLSVSLTDARTLRPPKTT